MPDFEDTLPHASEARRLAIEVIATLVNVKRIAADQILRRAGVPDDLVRRFLTGNDATTGQSLTKRQGGALILEELARRGGADQALTRRLIAIAADWDAFHLSQDEYKARAVVQKARELAGVLAEADALEKAERDQAALERAERERHAREQTLRIQSALLLAQFDHATAEGEPHERGFLLQDLLNRLFLLHGIAVIRAFQRNEGGEQIDAAFEMDGWHYIVECQWRARLANIRELDGVAGQVARSGRQTMGLFLSVNGWSKNVIPLLKQNPEKSILLMEGMDLRTVLSVPFDLRRLLKAKISALNLEAEPYFPVRKLFR
jgi:hypothetical protein